MTDRDETCEHIYHPCYRPDWPIGWLLPRVTRCIFCNAKPGNTHQNPPPDYHHIT